MGCEHPAVRRSGFPQMIAGLTLLTAAQPPREDLHRVLSLRDGNRLFHSNPASLFLLHPTPPRWIFHRCETSNTFN